MNFIFLPGDDVFHRLRAMAKKIGCSVSEALGIVSEIWMYAGRNADEQGCIDIDMDGLWYAVAANVSEAVERESLVTALQECEIVEMIDDCVCVIGWEKTQKPIYEGERAVQKAERRRLLDRDRKRRYKKQKSLIPELKSETEEVKTEDCVLHPEVKTEESEAAEKHEKKSKKDKPPKTEYAEFVHMYPEQYEKLIHQYGQKVTTELIRLLDNYKGSKGKTYKDDYRAILTWVVDAVREKNPSIFAAATPQQWHNDNPF
ncbi:MAG: hypothetical protein RSC06_00975 [Clostridia bacterium]